MFKIMPKIVNLLIVFCLIGSLSWAQSSEITLKSWRLNEQGKLQFSVNEGATWEIAEYNAESRLYALYFLTPEEGWAVGQNATVVRWDGERWSEVLVFSSEDLLSVYLQDSQNGWAVGTHGTVLFWDGLSWNQEDSFTSETLSAIKRLPNGSLQLTALSGTTFERIHGKWQAVAPVLSASMVRPQN